MRRVLVALLAVMLLATGCSLLPTSGVVHREADAGRVSPNDTAQFAPPGPGKGDSPTQVVKGFLLAMTAVAVVVLILVLRGVADNFAAGVLIQSRQSVKIGEEIVVEGPDGTLRGVVQELNGRAVLLTTVDGRTVQVGGPYLLKQVGAVELPVADAWREEGAIILHVLVDGIVAGALRLADEIRPESRAAVAALQQRGVEVVMGKLLWVVGMR